MLGRDVLVATLTQYGAYRRDVYLPAGTWFDYHSDQAVVSRGEWLRDVPVYRAGVLRLPAFVRAGAIVPQMRVEAGTLDAFGARADGAAASDLIVRVYAGPAANSFTLYEDDGTSLRFDERGKPVYATRTTELSQRSAGDTLTVTIAAADGGYDGAPQRRDNEVRVVLNQREATRVRIDGEEAVQVQDAAAYAAARGKVWRKEANMAYAKTGESAVAEAKVFELTTAAGTPRASAQFVCDEAWTRPNERVAIIGDIAALGGGDPARAVRLQPDVVYPYITDPPGSGPGPGSPKWTTVVSDLPLHTRISWKCVLLDDRGQVTRWARGDNQVMTTGESGYAGSSVCSF
jgi:alpha-glucosidase